MKHLEYRYTIGDQSWTLDIAALTVDDYIELKRITGYNVTRLAIEIDDMNPLALKGVIWLARRKSGDDIAWDDPGLSFRMADLNIEVVRDTTTGTPDESVDKEDRGDGEDTEPARPTKGPATARTTKPRTGKTTSKT